MVRSKARPVKDPWALTEVKVKDSTDWGRGAIGETSDEAWLKGCLIGSLREWKWVKIANGKRLKINLMVFKLKNNF
jgi:hypothetical protein